MPIIYRQSRVDELETIDALVVSSINDLTERHGFGQMASPSPPRFAQFCLRDDARGLWTAEDNGEPVGFSLAWSCDGFWFLAQLFVKPGVQCSGVGQALLSRALEHAQSIAAAQRALITFAFNNVSQGLYIRHGFTPRFPIYLMAGARPGLVPRSGEPLQTALLGGSDAEISELAGVDRHALGFSRAEHHRFLAAEPGVRVLGFQRAGRMAGYAYVSANGHIGPLAVVSPDLLETVFEVALSLSEVENVTCFLPGANARLLRRAMDHGLRIRFPMLMMSTGDLGGWPCYLPRNPGYM